MEIRKITGTTSGPSIRRFRYPKNTMLPGMDAEKIFPTERS